MCSMKRTTIFWFVVQPSVVVVVETTNLPFLIFLQTGDTSVFIFSIWPVTFWIFTIFCRDGGYETSPLIGKFCANQRPPVLVSHSNRLWVRFHSDATVTRFGFTAHWDGTQTGELTNHVTNCDHQRIGLYWSLLQEVYSQMLKQLEMNQFLFSALLRVPRPREIPNYILFFSSFIGIQLNLTCKILISCGWSYL